ncbi:F-box/kelch-repeat protein At1g15670 [Cryptomeria japonica]|uniref:F-box/kelch-repeat protein At1g15670 n=1 Tax=Cryptomeria japonica TaxID=3369 RepID=UPI0025AB9AC7|nr:F-box/kelch-repeat protein At1g15670 [Cryptomeria japonica]
MLRVELNSHHKLRCVCKSWNAALKSPHFYQERKRLRISEQRICMLQEIDGCNRVAVYVLEKNSYKVLPPVPTIINSICHCHFVKQKLVLIPFYLADSAKNCVWLYDFACSTWRRGAKMPRWLNAFASAADEDGGLIYVGGGLDRLYIGSAVRSASVYNVEEDKWDLLPDMNTYMEPYPTGVFAEGKFYVMGYSDSIEVFDSYTRNWKTTENRFKSWHYVSAFGRFYCLSGRGLIEYDYSQDKLHFLGSLPTEDWARLIDFAVVIRNKIFVHRDMILAQDFCMLEPPSETGGTFKLTGIEALLGFQGFAMYAATLDL